MVSALSSPLSSCLLQWWTVTWNVSRINPLFPCRSCWECLSRQQKTNIMGWEIQEDKLHLQGCAFKISTSFTQPLWFTLNNRNIFYYSSFFPPDGKKFNKLYVSAFSSSVYFYFLQENIYDEIPCSFWPQCLHCSDNCHVPSSLPILNSWWFGLLVWTAYFHWLYQMFYTLRDPLVG